MFVGMNVLRPCCMMITIAILMVYVQSIEESKLKRVDKNIKLIGPIDKVQRRFKKRDQVQENIGVLR